MNEPHISVTEQTFAEAWRQLIAYEEALEWPEKCRACECRTVCMKCAAGYTRFRTGRYPLSTRRKLNSFSMIFR